MDDAGNLRRCKLAVDIHKRRVGRRSAGTVYTMTDRTLAAIRPQANAGRGIVLDQRGGESNLICIDINDAGVGIDGGSTPLRAATDAGKEDGRLAQDAGNELSPANEGTKLLDRRRVRLRGSIGKRIFGDRPAVYMAPVCSGTGCVGEVTSPGTVLGGNLRSSIGNSDCPLVRSKRNTHPCLVVCATASMLLPFRRTVTNAGGAGKSRSHMSWCTPWKYQQELACLRIEAQASNWRTNRSQHGRRRRNQRSRIP